MRENHIVERLVESFDENSAADFVENFVDFAEIAADSAYGFAAAVAAAPDNTCYIVEVRFLPSYLITPFY